MASLIFTQPAAHADEADDFIQSPYFKGGKIDTFYDRRDNGGQDTNYFGGYARPLLTRPELGELFIGAQSVLQGDTQQTEAQAEYRLTNGLGFGGGYVDREFSKQDIKFAKVSYQNQWQDIKYILSTQWQKFADKDYPGGYIALYNKELMGTRGSDGEQWRSSFGYVSPDTGSKLPSICWRSTMR